MSNCVGVNHPFWMSKPSSIHQGSLTGHIGLFLLLGTVAFGWLVFPSEGGSCLSQSSIFGVESHETEIWLMGGGQKWWDQLQVYPGPSYRILYMCPSLRGHWLRLLLLAIAAILGTDAPGVVRVHGVITLTETSHCLGWSWNSGIQMMTFFRFHFYIPWPGPKTNPYLMTTCYSLCVSDSHLVSPWRLPISGLRLRQWRT